MVLVDHLRNVLRKFDLLQEVESGLAVHLDNRHFGVAESTRTREYFRWNRQLAEIVNSRSQFDRVDLSGLELEFGGHRSCNLSHAVLVTGGVGIAHFDGGRQSTDNRPTERCLTLLQFLPVSYVDHDNSNARHLAIHSDGKEIGKPVMDSCRVGGRMARHFLIDDRFTGVECLLIDWLQNGPQCWNDLSQSPSDLVFDLPAMH